MKPDKIRGLDNPAIEQELGKIDEQMFRVKLQMSMGQSEGLKKVRTMKKDRARMLTILRQRELEAAK